jgi:hypothetical protein
MVPPGGGGQVIQKKMLLCPISAMMSMPYIRSAPGKARRIMHLNSL